MPHRIDENPRLNPCRFCKEVGFKSESQRYSHQKACYLNPKLLVNLEKRKNINRRNYRSNKTFLIHPSLQGVDLNQFQVVEANDFGVGYSLNAEVPVLAEKELDPGQVEELLNWDPTWQPKRVPTNTDFRDDNFLIERKGKAVVTNIDWIVTEREQRITKRRKQRKAEQAVYDAIARSQNE